MQKKGSKIQNTKKMSVVETRESLQKRKLDS